MIKVPKDKTAFCIMFYDWETGVGAELLSYVEAVFSKFELSPSEGTGSLGKAHSHGGYSRVKGRLKQFLDSQFESCVFGDVRVLSEKTYDRELPFCPSKLGFTYGFGERRHKSSVFYVVLKDEIEKTMLLDEVENRIFKLTGCFYGGAFEMPAKLGPCSYLCSIATWDAKTGQPPTREYAEKITRFRDSVYSGKYPAMGYFREAYSINYVTQEHLDREIDGQPLADFMRSNGTVKQCDFNAKMYRWDIPKEKIEYANEWLEKAGLIL